VETVATASCDRLVRDRGLVSAPDGVALDALDGVASNSQGQVTRDRCC